MFCAAFPRGGRPGPKAARVISRGGSLRRGARRAGKPSRQPPRTEFPYRVRVWDNAASRQIERVIAGLDEAKALRDEFTEGKRRSGRPLAELVRFVDVAARYLVAYRVKRDGTPGPKSSLATERACLNVYILPVLGSSWIGDVDLPDLNAALRGLTLQDGTPAAGARRAPSPQCCGGYSPGRAKRASSRQTLRSNCVPAGAARCAGRSLSPASRRFSGSRGRSITSRQGLAMWPSFWRLRVFGGKRASRC